MVVQVSCNERKALEVGDALGLLAYLTALISYIIQTQHSLGYTTFESIIAPALPWLLSVALIAISGTKPLRRYWWVFPSIVLANPTLLLIGLMMLAWSIGGFV